MEVDKIYNCDCYEFLKTLPDKCIDLVYTDIPYLITGAKKPRQQKGRSVIGRAIDNSQIDIDDIIHGIDYSILDELVRVSKHIYMYIWCSKDQIYPISKVFVEKYNCKLNYLVWCKTNCLPMVSTTLKSNVEYCLQIRGDGAKPMVGNNDKKSKYYISSTNTQDKALYDHPTIKPLEFVKDHIVLSTNPGDLVFDPFMGSGTTAVACKETGRHYLGCELNKEYYDKCIARVNGVIPTDSGVESSLW